MNRKKLKEIMVMRDVSFGQLSKRTKICKIILALKIFGVLKVRVGDITKILRALKLSDNEVRSIFFG